MKVYRDVVENGVTTRIEIFDIVECTYTGKDMSERSITATILWPSPIDFKVGDYVQLSMQSLLRSGDGVSGSILSGTDAERFYIYTMPTIKKNSRSLSAGNAFEHAVTFYPPQYELGLIQMRDCGQENATSDTIIYSGFDTLTFVGGANELMRRIMAVLKEAYHDADGNALWSYKIANEVNEDRNTALESVTFSFSGNSVMDAVLKLNDTEGLNTTFFINGRTIYVGYKRPYFCRVTDNNVIDIDPATQMFQFKYGKTSNKSIAINHGGLYNITKSVGKESPITKLFAYGANRNLNRYYCSDRIQSGRYVNKLMLPSFGDDGRTDYILSESSIERYGIREGSKQFEDIYPSLRYITYGDLRQVQYCIQIKYSEEISKITNLRQLQKLTAYPVARVQCYKVVQSDTTGINKLVEAAPPEDLVIILHAVDKVVKVRLYGGETGSAALIKQLAADSKVPTYTKNGTDYIPGSCFAVHDRGFDTDKTYACSSRSLWFTNPNEFEDTDLTEEQRTEIEMNQIEYEDTFWLSDMYVFKGYKQSYFPRDGYSAWCWPRTNINYLGGSPDSILVNEVVAVEPIVIEDTSTNIDGLSKQQKTFDLYLRDVGFKIDEQTDFGEMVHIVGTTLKISMLDGLLTGREFTAAESVTDSQYTCICAYNEDGTLNDDFFMDSDYTQGKSIPNEALAKGAIWRICVKRINLDDADYSNLNLILPTKDLCVKAGDHLVFLDIFMPDIYIHAAENRLLREARKYLDANDNGSISYSAQFDTVRLQQIPNYALQMREGLNIRMVDDDLDIRTRNRVLDIFKSDTPLLSYKSPYTTTYDKTILDKYYYTAVHRDYRYLVQKGIYQHYEDLIEGEIFTHADQIIVTPPSSAFNSRYTGVWYTSATTEDSQGDGEMYAEGNRVKVRLVERIYINNNNFYKLTNQDVDLVVDSCSQSIDSSGNKKLKVNFHLENVALKIHTSTDSYGVTEQYFFGFVEYDIRYKHEYTETGYTPNTHIIAKGFPFYCPSSQLVEFRASKHYVVTIDVENTTMPYFDTDSDKYNLFALLNNLGENASYYIPAYTYEELTSDDSKWRRFKFSFDLESGFNDGQDYYPAIQYISDGVTESVSVRLVSIVESDVEGNEDLNYVDLLVENFTLKITEHSDNVNAIPLREITATFTETPTATTWATLMQNVENNRIEGTLNEKTIETLVNTARKNYQTLLNLRNSIFDPDGTCDKTFLQVMMMQVGADSMNYQLDKTRVGFGANGAQVFYNCSCAKSGSSWYFKVMAADTLRHYVYTEGAQTGTWAISNGISTPLDGESNYFICIKCLREGNTAEWICSTKQYAVNDEEDTTAWFFNWGILTVDSAGNYTLTETRGNAYMYGDNLVCGKISTLAGQSYFDLTKGDFVLSNGTTKALSYENGILTIGGVATEEDAEAILERLGLAETNITKAQSTADAAQSALDNLQIGGRNLAIFNTATVSSMRKGTDYDFAQTIADTRTQLYFSVEDFNGSNISSFKSYVHNKIITETGTYSFAFTLTADTSLLRLKHNGLKYDVISIFHFTETLKAGTNLVLSVTFTNVTQGSFAWKNVKIEKGNKPTDWTPAPEDVEAEITESKTYAKGLVDTLGTTLQNQIDGVVDSYFMEGAPTTSNAPAKDWTTDELKARHEGDTYTDITKYVSDTATPTAGHSWRWCKGTGESAGTWHWHEIADSDAVRALQNAAKAQDTADGKRRVFVTTTEHPTPYPPYDIGDLWAQGGDTNQDILKCKVARATGNYVASDWESASSALQAAQNAQAAVDNMEVGGENLYYLANPLTLTATSTDKTYYYILLENLENGKKYTFSCEKSVRLAGTATKYSVVLYNFATNTIAQYYDLSIGNTRQTCTFTVPADNGNWRLLIYAGVKGSTAGNSLQWTDIMIQKGNKTTAYQQPAWKPLYNKGISISYSGTAEAAYLDLLYNIPAGTYKATMGYEKRGDGAEQDVSGAYSNSCVVWYKAGGDGYSDVLAITDWGETVQIAQAADVVVYTGVKSFIEAHIEDPGTTGVYFPADGTWYIAAARILTYVTDSIAGSAAEAKTKAAALDYLKAALTDGSTQVAGGLLMTNVLMLKSLAGAVTAGMSGLTKKTGTSTADNVLLWGGGNYEEAFYAANNANYYKSSSSTTPITTLIKKDGTGKIGIFKISNTQVEINVPNQGKIIIDGSTTKAGIIMYDTSGNEKLKIIPRSISNSSDIPKAPTTETHASFNGAGVYEMYTNDTYEFEIGDYLTVDDYNRETTITYNVSAYIRATPNQGTTTDAQAQIKLWLQRLDGQGTYNIATISSNKYTINEDEEGDLAMSGYGTFTQVLSSGSVWKLMCSIGRATSTIDVVGYAINSQTSIKWTYLQRYPYTPKVILGLDGLLCANDYEHFFKLYTGAGGGTQQIIMAGLPTSATNLTTGQLYRSGTYLRIV